LYKLREFCDDDDDSYYGRMDYDPVSSAMPPQCEELTVSPPLFCPASCIALRSITNNIKFSASLHKVLTYTTRTVYRYVICLLSASMHATSRASTILLDLIILILRERPSLRRVLQIHPIVSFMI
jgi:hypothetical protein